ncbi:leucine-rich repeat domain-containing protein [uncultured Fibrobacter sp.]|uniref:leucine-rich repeat domain-containing protein n=1 Tax=uncultured Fibrobacter sp. TaxID=261512 RepID=UPI002621CD16|nr:leucine-rich repeat domain-containing protein [uncultured Fibrobacter sp.]
MLATEFKKVNFDIENSKLQAIRSYTFSNCSSLISITLPNLVAYVEANAFKNNKKITKVTIGNNIVTIGKNAFYGCKKLKSITFKTAKLTSKKVGSKAFKGTPKNAVVKVPKKSLMTYKKFLYKKGLNKKAKITK